MNRLTRPVLSITCLAALLASPAAAADNLLINGSFESGPALTGLFVDVPGGSTAITGWTVGDLHVDYCGPGVWNASDGVRSIDLDGSGPGPRNGSVFQTIATTPGETYLVTYDLAANTTGLPLVKQLEVSAGPTVLIDGYDIGSVKAYTPPLALTYAHHSVTFTAVAATSTVKFRSLTQLSGSPTGWGAVIDNVVVQQVAWTDLGFALAGISGAPQLAGTGNLLPGSSGSLVLSHAAPSAPALLFIALAGSSAPFKCGTLVPVPTLTTLALATSPSGSIPLAWPSWPAGLSGFGVHFQYAVKDTAAPCGAALSNALRGNVP